MGVRDIVIFALLAVAFFAAMGRPWIGILFWVWVSVMNPHRLTYGFVYGLPVAAAAAAVAVGSLFFTRDKVSLPLRAPPILWLAAFVLWMNIASLFPIHPDQIFGQYSKVMKVLFMTFVAAAALNSREHLRALVWVLVISLGFYGVKGGVFTLMHGGHFMVRGPAGSFIEPNNELALALVMTVPLMRYLQLEESGKWVKRGLGLAMLATSLSVLGSQSRGALIAIGAMVFALWWRSQRKLPLLVAIFVLAPVMLAFMPQAWWDRMGTIKAYDEDASAQGRINAWYMAWNLAKDRFFGGGFEIYDDYVFGLYAPVPTDVHAAHSIYFQVLGEHGFGGLLLFLGVWISTWMTVRWIRRNASTPECKWAYNLASMVEVSLVGYAVGGAFLSLSYFDLPYYLLIAVVVIRYKIMHNQGHSFRRGSSAPSSVAAPVADVTVNPIGSSGTSKLRA